MSIVKTPSWQLTVLVLSVLATSCSSERSPPLPEEVLLAFDGVAQMGVLAENSRGELLAFDQGIQDLGVRLALALSQADRFSVRFQSNAAYLSLEFTGNYFDGNTAAEVSAPVSLRAFLPASMVVASRTTNVNVLTTLIAPRIEFLSRAAMSTENPVAVAERELHEVLRYAALGCNPTGMHLLDQTVLSPGGAYLLRVSLMALRAATDMGIPLNDFLRAFSADFADNGRLDDPALSAALDLADQRVDYSTASAALVARYAAAGRAIQVAPISTCAVLPPTTPQLHDVIAIVGETVHFDSTGTTSAAGGAIAYHWTVRREQSDRPYFPTPPFDTYEFDSPALDFRIERSGSWLVTLIATDAFGGVGVSRARFFGRYEFQPNGDGTARNLQTGLVWQVQDDGNQYTLAEARGIPVLAAGDDHGLNVCGNLVLGAFSDWRVPSLLEVSSTLDFSRATFPIVEALIPYTRAGAFYISNSWVPNSKADYIYTLDGLIYHQEASQRTYVRCVRP